MKIEFKTKEHSYRLEATRYGCDVFVDGEYFTTYEDSEKHSKDFWIGQAMTYLFDNNVFKDTLWQNG